MQLFSFNPVVCLFKNRVGIYFTIRSFIYISTINVYGFSILESFVQTKYID